LGAALLERRKELVEFVNDAYHKMNKAGFAHNPIIVEPRRVLAPVAEQQTLAAP